MSPVTNFCKSSLASFEAWRKCLDKWVEVMPTRRFPSEEGRECHRPVPAQQYGGRVAVEGWWGLSLCLALLNFRLAWGGA